MGSLTRVAIIAVAAIAAAVTAVLLLGRAVPLHGVRPATALATIAAVISTSARGFDSHGRDAW